MDLFGFKRRREEQLDFVAYLDQALATLRPTPVRRYRAVAVDGDTIFEGGCLDCTEMIASQYLDAMIDEIPVDHLPCRLCSLTI
jgi:hypothetical protein